MYKTDWDDEIEIESAPDSVQNIVDTLEEQLQNEDGQLRVLLEEETYVVKFNLFDGELDSILRTVEMQVKSEVGIGNYDIETTDTGIRIIL